MSKKKGFSEESPLSSKISLSWEQMVRQAQSDKGKASAEMNASTNASTYSTKKTQKESGHPSSQTNGEKAVSENLKRKSAFKNKKKKQDKETFSSFQLSAQKKKNDAQRTNNPASPSCQRENITTGGMKQEENILFHLQALRTTLIHCLSALVLLLIPLFFAAPYALDGLTKIILAETDISLNYFSPMEVFIIQIKTAFLLDIVVCFPYIAREIWNFILPGLYPHERKIAVRILVTSSVLFIFGAVFCLFFILPLIIEFGAGYATEQIRAVFGLENVISLSLWLILAFGVMFQLPLLTYALIRTGLVSFESVRNKRPYIIVLLLFVAAILTPPDIVSQLLLFLPTYLLFEGALFFAGKTTGKTNKRTGKKS